MTGPASGSRFVGRADELSSLRAAWQQATQEAPGTVVVAGEAGIGKSRLVAELAAEVRAGGGIVLIGTCRLLGDEPVPYAAFGDVTRSVAHDAGLAVAAGLADLSDDLAPLLPRRHAPAPAPSPDGPATGPAARSTPASATRLAEGVADLLERLAMTAPLLLVIEDLHWADAGTRDLLAFLARVLSEPGVLVATTVRTDDLVRGHPLPSFLAGLERLPTVHRVDLGPLDDRDVTALLAGLDAGPAAEQILPRARGNPYFAEELAGCCGSGDALPRTLADLLLERVERLSDGARRLVRTLAAGEDRVSHALLAQVAQETPEDLDRLLRELVDAQVIVVAGEGYAFRHGLLRDAVHADLLPGERPRLHARYAAALEADRGLSGSGRPATALARHWYAAGEAAMALRRSYESAAELRLDYALAERQRALERVLELWERVPDAADLLGRSHLDVLEEAADAAMARDDLARADTLARAAADEAAGTDPPPGRDVDVARLALAQARVSRVAWARGRRGARTALAAALARLDPQQHAAERARLLASAAEMSMVAGDVAGCLAAGQEALALIGPPDGPDGRPEVRTRTAALVPTGFALVWSDRIEEGLGLIRQAAAIGRAAGETTRESSALVSLSDALEGLGRHEEAVAVAREGLAQARAIGRARTIGTVLAINLAEPLAALGRWREADGVLADALALSPGGGHRISLEALAARLDLAQGQVSWARAHVAAARQADADGGTTVAQDRLPLVLAEVEILLAEGRSDEAAGVLATTLERYGPAPGTAKYLWPLLPPAARLTARGARPALAPLLLAVHADMPVVGASAAAWAAETRAALATEATPNGEMPAHAAGAARADAVASWLEAAAAWAGLAEPYAQARCLLAAAECAAAGGQRAPAADLLVEARAALARVDRDPTIPPRGAAWATAARLGHRLGLPTEAVRAVAASSSGSSDVADSWRLTPREREVLRLLAEGRSNGAIAQELVISTKTASVHVSNILAKLGVSGRGEAAALAHRQGLVDA